MFRRNLAPPSSSTILVYPMTEAIGSFEMSILTIAKRYNIPEYGVLDSHRRGKLRSYINIL
jgi:hypothetical protein